MTRYTGLKICSNPVGDARLRPAESLPGLRLGKPAFARSLIPPKRSQIVRFAKADRPVGIRSLICQRCPRLVPPKRGARRRKADRPVGFETLSDCGLRDCPSDEFPIIRLSATSRRHQLVIFCTHCQRRPRILPGKPVQRRLQQATVW